MNLTENIYLSFRNMSSDVDQFVEQVLTERTFHAFTTLNNSPFEKCFDFVLTVLQDDLGFSNQAVVVPYDGCQIIELSKAMQTFVIVLYEGGKTSAMLVDKHFPQQESLVDLLNQCMLTLWTPVQMNPELLCGILILFTDGSLVATAQYVDERARISLTIRNIFVERVLLELDRDDHLERGLPLLQEAMKEHLKSLELELPPMKRFKVAQHLSSKNDKFRLVSAADSISFVKFLAEFARVRDQR